MHRLEVHDMMLKTDELSLHIPHLRFNQGKTCYIIGKSGSGKSLFAGALSGMPITGLKVTGEVAFDGKPTTETLWRDQIFVLPQEPAVALDPTMPVGKQLGEIFRWRRDPACPWQTPEELGREVQLSAQDLGKFPAQLSGGMQQRIMIAMALAAKAAFVIADEPTKGLDAQSKARVIDLFKKIQASGRGLIVITHDLDVARALADHVTIFDNGGVVEQGPCNRVLVTPDSDAAKMLLDSEPGNWPEKAKAPQITATPIISLENVSFGYTKDSVLVRDASFEVLGGQIIGLYGPSGAGKSSLADVCLGLQKPQSGTVRWLGDPVSSTLIRAHRPQFQKLFQNPVTSFPPNLKLADVFEKLTPHVQSSQFTQDALMSRLGLDQRLLERRPHQVSGGELQRLAIVRVLMAQPKFLVCDEASSRLDMTIQRLAIDTIADYASQTSAAVLLISHDYDVLKKRADYVFELQDSGRLQRD